MIGAFASHPPTYAISARSPSRRRQMAGATAPCLDRRHVRWSRYVVDLHRQQSLIEDDGTLRHSTVNQPRSPGLHTFLPVLGQGRFHALRVRFRDVHQAQHVPLCWSVDQRPP
jgi:hypothetical protein